MNTYNNSIEALVNVVFTKVDGVTTRTLNKVEIPAKALDVALIVKAKAINDAQQNLLALQVANGVLIPEFSATKILGHRTAKGWQTLNKLSAVVKAIALDAKKAAKLTAAVNLVIENAERKTAVNIDLIHTAAKKCGLIVVEVKVGEAKETDADKVTAEATKASKFAVSAFLAEYTAQMLDKGAITAAQAKAIKAGLSAK